MEKLTVYPEPCSSCPYRIDCPSGVWHEEEYQKLPDFDENAGTPSYATFHCHHETTTGVPTVCRGWLTVHQESVAVRLAMLTEQVTLDEVYAPVKTPLFASGQAACDAGVANIEEPDEDAERVIQKLLKARAKLNDQENS